MSAFFDLLLAHPLPSGWTGVLLFSGFYLHMALVLLALGTAFLAVEYCAAACFRPGPGTEGWDRRILRPFMAFKSLAVVLGVAPLLLIQVGWTVTFFNAIGLFSGLWMLVIGLLVVSFVSFDSLAHGMRVHRLLHLGLGITALLLLAAVPGIFAAVLVAAENPGAWTAILERGFFLPGSLMFHWSMRYLHVLGAALVFGALFHFFFTSGRDPEKRAGMKSWILAGTLAQVVSGPLLLVSLPLDLDTASVVDLALGLLLLGVFAGLLFSRRAETRGFGLRPSAALLLGILAFMLLVRENQQERSVAAVESAAESRKTARARALAPYEEEALAGYRDDLGRVYDNGPTIYGRSCAFCHAENGDGRGPEAGGLAVAPEDISGIRASRTYLMEILARGVRGTAMPYFAVFVRGKLEGLVTYLDERWDVVGSPAPIQGITEADLEKAREVYSRRCAGCHGPDGVPTAAAEKFEPPPPPFTEYSLLPARADEVMTGGYHGTMMGGFAVGLSPELKKALIQVLYDLRRKET